MAASSAILTDIGTVITTGPAAATITKYNAAAGPIQDWKGNVALAKLKFQEASALLTVVKAGTDASDGTLTQINAVLAALGGTSSPSTTYLADMATVISTGPAAATLTKSRAAAGPIQDWYGNNKLALLKLQEAKALLTVVKAATDSGDTVLTQINSILEGLA